MSLILAALGGFLLGVGVTLAVARVLQKTVTEARLRSVTRILFIATLVAAICWVSCSYIIAGYATVFLGQAFPVVELSDRAITTILGVIVLKVTENLFEHNDGGIFGKSKGKSNDNSGGTI